MIKKIITIYCVTSLVFFGCTDSVENKKESQMTQEELLDEMSSMEDEEDVGETFYLPSALQIGSIFQNSGLTYILGLTHNPANANKYVTKSQLLLNFGVYSADLAYIVLNEQNQVASTYLKTLKEISSKIGFGQIFESEELFTQFDKSIGNKDSILSLMIDVQMTTDDYVDENNLQASSYVIFAGAWIEGMYLGVKAIGTSNQHTISGRLLEQMTILDNLVRAIGSNKIQTSEIKQLLIDLETLDSFFLKLDENKKSQNISSFRDYKISKEHLEELSKMIIDLRTRITKA